MPNEQDQLTTIEEALSIRDQVNQHPEIGGGVKPYNPDTAMEPDTLFNTHYEGESGIYVPQYNGPFRTPQNGENLFFHFRFNNGFMGYNVGLCQQMIKNYPTSWVTKMATEVNA